MHIENIVCKTPAILLGLQCVWVDYVEMIVPRATAGNFRVSITVTS